LLVLSAVFHVWGYAAGIVVVICAIGFNRTVAGKSYVYPLVPLDLKELGKRLFRGRLPVQRR